MSAPQTYGASLYDLAKDEGMSREILVDLEGLFRYLTNTLHMLKYLMHLKSNVMTLWRYSTKISWAR